MSGAENSVAAPSARNRAWDAIRALLGLLLLAWVVRRTEAWSDPRVLREASWLLVPAVALTLLGAVVEAVRLTLLLRPQGVAVSVADAFRLVAVSTLWGFAVPGGVGGDVAKAVYLGRRDRSRLVELGMGLLVDRFVGLMSMLTAILILAALSAEFVLSSTLLKTLTGWAAVAFAGLAAAFALSQTVWLRRTVLFEWATTRGPGAGFVRRVLDALAAYRRHTAPLAAAFLTSLSGNAVLCATFLLAAREFAPGLVGLRPALLGLFGMLANAIPLTPAGVGVGEAAFEALFQSAGFAGGALVSLTWRAGVLAVALIGAVFYAWGVRLDAGEEALRAAE